MLSLMNATKEAHNEHVPRNESELVHVQRRIERLVLVTKETGVRDGLLIALEIIRHEASFPRP